MAEVFLTPLFGVFFEQLASDSLLNYAKKFAGISSSELKRWERKLRVMESVLIDAEEKQLTDRAVKQWLDDLRDLAYDVEDILDEFATEARRRELKAKNPSEVRCLLAAPFCRRLKFNRDMAAKVEIINGRMDELCENINILRLSVGSGATSSSTTSVFQRTPSTCLPPEYEVGRNGEKEKILESVLCHDSSEGDSNYQVVSIVGLGGIGKTTLAQAVYNHDRVVKNFDLRAWACVSQGDYDVLKISKAILESLTSSQCDLKELNEVQLKLQEKLAGKKFLVILDDVWSKKYNNWAEMRSPFAAGARGSKVIVTTRYMDVASTMGSINSCELNSLSDDDCWTIFKKHAFLNTDASGRGDQEKVREKVVQRCRGLPLAARTLGGLLRCKRRHEWEGILNSKILELSSDECDILPVLRLSYQYLPGHLKRCFAYCAIFHQHYEFQEKEVVFLWMAEGLLLESQSNKQMEDLGSEYFQDLLSRSIFQKSNHYPTRYVMHDLVNDLAQSVSGKTSFRLEDKRSISFEKARHSSYISDWYERKNKFEIFYKTQHLRTFLPLHRHSNGYCSVTNTIVSDLLPKLKKLRVLSLKGYRIYELPDSIGYLIHLRALDLTRTLIRSLPESTSALLNLQTLILKYCYRLRTLPSKMEDLINLHCLDIRGADLISEMPIGIRELKSLRILSNFVVGKDKGSNLKHLKNLKFLRGKLRISRLENVNDVNGAILNSMNDLNVLTLEWRHQSNSHSPDGQVESKVLDMLRPHKNLEEFTITGYHGNGFPCWIGDSSFSNMKVLRLMNCENCTSLPSLGQLSCLKELAIQGIRGVQMISSEIYGESLEILSLKELEDWEQWDPMQGNMQVSRFPRLCKLSIVNCPRLSGNLPHNLTSLEALMIRNCAELVVTLSNSPMLHDITIDRCKRVVCNSPRNSKQVKSMNLSSISDSQSSLIHRFQKVDYLNISDCENLISRWQYDIFLETQPMEKHSHTSLVELCIKSFPSLISIPDFCSLSYLKKLEISQCNVLTSLPNGVLHDNSHLESLTIDSCDSLIFVAKGQLPASLKKLSIKSCEKLQYLTFDGREDAGTLSCSSTSSLSHGERITNDSITIILDKLEIIECPSLICLFSNGLHPAIKGLLINSCPNLTTLFSEGQLPHLLQHLHIFNCSKLELIAERFHNHMSLEYLSINSCENLKSIPDGLKDIQSLREIDILFCKRLVYFLQGGIPNNISKFAIKYCENLEAPSSFLHNLNNLTELDISGADLNIYKSFTEWGLHKLTTLKTLRIRDCEDAVSFPEDEKSMLLPPSLTRLSIFGFPKLKHLSSRGFKTLTSLEHLWIIRCPKLTFFPKEGLPFSLLSLRFRECPALKERCKRDKGKEWHKIAYIPCVEIDSKNVYEPDENK